MTICLLSSGVEQYASVDDVFHGFFTGCIAAGPEKCALAKGNITAAALETSVAEFLAALKFQPIPLAGTLIDYSAIKSTIGHNYIDYPSTWPQMAQALDGVMNGNLTELEDAFGTIGSGSAPAGQANEAIYGIRCSDGDARASSLLEFQPAAQEFEKRSKWLGDGGPTTSAKCAQWSFEAEERYSGDFCVKTRNPMLFIGNTYDPATPLVSAKNVTATFEGSVLLQHNGYGVSIASIIALTSILRTVCQCFYAAFIMDTVFNVYY